MGVIGGAVPDYEPQDPDNPQRRTTGLFGGIFGGGGSDGDGATAEKEPAEKTAPEKDQDGGLFGGFFSMDALKGVVPDSGQVKDAARTATIRRLTLYGTLWEQGTSGPRLTTLGSYIAGGLALYGVYRTFGK